MVRSAAQTGVQKGKQVATRQHYLPFGTALRQLLQDRQEFLTKTGNVNYRLVANALDGVHYETLRKAAAGDRSPTVHLMEQLAELLNVSPDYFTEYRFELVQREYDVKEVGWENAVKNLRRFVQDQTG